MLQNVIIGWLTRRGLELGGIAAGAVAWYMSRSPAEQDAINRLFTGGWREVPIGVYVGIGVTVWGYVWSYRSTVKPQVVTDKGQQIPLRKDGAAAREVEAVAKMAIPPKTLAERIGGIFARR